MGDKVNRWRRGLMAAAGAAILWGSPALAQAPGEPSAVNIPTCDRACLIGHVRAYMGALGQRDPAPLNFSADERFTENNVLIPWPIRSPGRRPGSALSGSMARRPIMPCACASKTAR